MLTIQAGTPSVPGTHARSRAGMPRWPLPALAAWAVAWALYLRLEGFGLSPGLSAGAATAAGLGLGLLGGTRLRGLVIAAGFPLSLLASGAAFALPGWAWLLPMALLLLLYPHHAWRDAPLYPTPACALDALSAKAVLPRGARVLDAGCGLGHGLRALRRTYPHAQLEGIEWSWPLAWTARLRCRWATVRRGDMWAQSWRDYQLVYLFQRPESLPRAVAKANAEMAQGAWLASLEFEAEQWLPQAMLRCADGRPLWLYRLPLRALPGKAAATAASSGAPAGR
jgi:hypothetical protein